MEVIDKGLWDGKSDLGGPIVTFAFPGVVGGIAPSYPDGRPRPPIEPGERPTFKCAGDRALLYYKNGHAMMLRWNDGRWSHRGCVWLPMGWLWIWNIRDQPFVGRLDPGRLPD